VLVILALLTAELASSTLPGNVSPRVCTGPSLRWSPSCLLVCLMAHEAAHAVVARRQGATVKSIPLWMLGGVTQHEGGAADAGSDLHIAIVGPAVSLVAPW
jgi:Zn-dependent protease